MKTTLSVGNHFWKWRHYFVYWHFCSDFILSYQWIKVTVLFVMIRAVLILILISKMWQDFLTHYSIMKWCSYWESEGILLLDDVKYLTLRWYYSRKFEYWFRVKKEFTWKRISIFRENFALISRTLLSLGPIGLGSQLKKDRR